MYHKTETEQSISITIIAGTWSDVLKKEQEQGACTEIVRKDGKENSSHRLFSDDRIIDMYIYRCPENIGERFSRGSR